MKNKWGNVNLLIYWVIFVLSMTLILSLLILIPAILIISIPAIVIGSFLFSVFLIILLGTIKPYSFYLKYDAFYNNFNYNFWGTHSQNLDVSNVIKKFMEYKKYNYSIQSLNIRKYLKFDNTYILNDFDLYLGISNFGVVIYSLKKHNENIEQIKDEISNYLNTL